MGYILGAVVCGIAAWQMRKRGIHQKVQQAALVLAAGFLLASAFWQLDSSSETQSQVGRNPPGGGEKEKEYLIDADGMLEQYPLTIQIEEKKLTKEQRQECLKDAKQELDVLILGENPSLERVSKPLYLPEALQGGAVTAEYHFSDYDVFDITGKITDTLAEPVFVEVSAELSCQGETCLYAFFVQAVPRDKSKKELFAEKLQQLLASENNREDTEFLQLPKEVDGIGVRWSEQRENRAIAATFLGLAGAFGIICSEKEGRKKKEMERRRQMMLDYPEIISKLSLLLGAGMNITCAWEKITSGYQALRKRSHMPRREAYEEMVATLHEIQQGVGELQAFENFGERCRLSVYRKLSSLIVQNIRKGAKGMQRLLDTEEREAFELRKAQARKMGEEAGTKLLLPMGMMLVVVLVILLAPAGLTFQA